MVLVSIEYYILYVKDKVAQYMVESLFQNILFILSINLKYKALEDIVVFANFLGVRQLDTAMP